jgi:hypothetical protein
MRAKLRHVMEPGVRRDDSLWRAECAPLVPAEPTVFNAAAVSVSKRLHALSRRKMECIAGLGVARSEAPPDAATAIYLAKAYVARVASWCCTPPCVLSGRPAHA